MLVIPFSPHTLRRTFASVANEAGVPYLTFKRLLNHSLRNDVTSRYVQPAFNPGQFRDALTTIESYILEKRDEYLGASRPVGQEKSLSELQLYMTQFGLDPAEVLTTLKVFEKTEPNDDGGLSE